MLNSSPLLRRALWHANRTPLAKVSKAVLSAVHARDVQARRLAARDLALPAGIAERAARLAADGWASLDGALDPELLAALDRASADRVARVAEREAGQASTHKNFWVRLLDADVVDGAFDVDNVFVRFALQPAVIGLVAARLGELPRLMDVLLTYSRPTDSALAYSQLWHRDHDDVRTVKVFVYLTDVKDSAEGPFTFLPGPASDRVGFLVRSHLPDAEFFARASASDLVEMRAPRLAAFACETSRCLHMGSRVHPGHARLMYTATFISAPSLYPRSVPRFRANRPLTERERLVLAL